MNHKTAKYSDGFYKARRQILRVITSPESTSIVRPDTFCGQVRRRLGQTGEGAALRLQRFYILRWPCGCELNSEKYFWWINSSSDRQIKTDFLLLARNFSNHLALSLAVSSGAGSPVLRQESSI